MMMMIIIIYYYYYHYYYPVQIYRNLPANTRFAAVNILLVISLSVPFHNALYYIL